MASVVEVYTRALLADGQLAVAVAAIKALTSVIVLSKSETMMGLEIELSRAADMLRKYNPSSISLSAGVELFMRYVSRTASLDSSDLVKSKAWLIDRGHLFAETSLKARAKIAELGECFVRNGSVVFTHGSSRVVLALLKRAAAEGKHFSVVVCLALVCGTVDDAKASIQVTEGRPDSTGPLTARLLAEAGVPVRPRRIASAIARPAHSQQVTLVLDSAAAFMMERVDMVRWAAAGQMMIRLTAQSRFLSAQRRSWKAAV